jgi:hypothetical protein
MKLYWLLITISTGLWRKSSTYIKECGGRKGGALQEIGFVLPKFEISAPYIICLPSPNVDIHLLEVLNCFSRGENL